MSRLGAAKKRAQQRMGGATINVYPGGFATRDEARDALVAELIRQARIEASRRPSMVEPAPPLPRPGLEEPIEPTPVPASQGQRARVLVLGLLLVACVAWWALALWEVLR